MRCAHLNRIAIVLAVAVAIAGAAQGRSLVVADMARLADLSEPELSPDGEALAYVVSTANPTEDQTQSDLWRVGFDGKGRDRLTNTPTQSEWRPLWSPDGTSIAFLADTKSSADENGEPLPQVWLVPSRGGKPRQLSAFSSGVDDYVWAPDGKRLAVIVRDPEFPPGKRPKNPAPIVTDRYQFKEDGVGYLDHRRSHLYVLEIANGRYQQLTRGAHDEQLPAWSPDGKLIAYVSKRGAEPDRHLNFDIYVMEPSTGASERRLTSFAGADLDPYWESRPAWSPDSKRIAYLSSGEDKWIYYAPWQLAIIDVESGRWSIPAPIDRCFSRPRWSPDGTGVYALVEQSRVTRLSHIDVRDGRVREITSGNRFDYDLSVAASGRMVVLGGGDLHPHTISAVEGQAPQARLRTLADHNEFLAGLALAPVEPVQFMSDGVLIEGMLVKPIGYQPGLRYPTIVRIHGGPVYQFSHEFMVDWQLYAARGYAVLAVNPRGSSGRGFEFSRAIYADWGNKDLRDVLAGADHVVAIGVADPARLGVGGWSYGSILTNAVIAGDARFKAAVSGAGASNMFAMYGHDQYIREYELELGTPWGDGAKYARASAPFLHADRITTPTLFQCAQEDLNVPCLGAEQMFQALVSRGLPTQLVVYPGEGHQLTVPSYLQDRMRRNIAWYDRFLSPPIAPPPTRVEGCVGSLPGECR